MSGRLTGRVAIVTGAARGIGAAIARRFVLEGACVALLDIDADAVHAEAAPIGGAALNRLMSASTKARQL